MTDGSSTEKPYRDGFMSCPCGRGDYDLCNECPYDWCSVHGNVDEIVEDIRQALADLDGSRLSTISLLTGISTEKLIELGGVYDGEQPAVRAVRDHAAGEQDVP